MFTGLDWFYFFLLVILEITLIKQRCGLWGRRAADVCGFGLVFSFSGVVNAGHHTDKAAIWGKQAADVCRFALICFFRGVVNNRNHTDKPAIEQPLATLNSLSCCNFDCR